MITKKKKKRKFVLFQSKNKCVIYVSPVSVSFIDFDKLYVDGNRADMQIFLDWIVYALIV